MNKLEWFMGLFWIFVLTAGIFVIVQGYPDWSYILYGGICVGASIPMIHLIFVKGRTE